MNRPECICASCSRPCTLRSDRILYCDTYIGRNGERLGKKRKTGRHDTNIKPQDVGLERFYSD